MADKPKAGPTERSQWPRNHSNAATDRDMAADKATNAAKMARRGIERINGGEITRQELIYLFAVILADCQDILRLMERNGAPTRPY